MQKLFEQSGHPFREIKGMRFTFYVRTCKDCFKYQKISSEKLEALDSQPILEHAKIFWAIRTFLVRHWAHKLCWNMQRLFEQSGYFFWGIRGTEHTPYVRTCKGCFEQSEHLLWEVRGIGLTCYAKIVSAIRKSLQRNQRPRTHSLCWDIQRLFEQSEHSFKDIRGTELTPYVGTCKDCFQQSGHLLWEIRGIGLTCYAKVVSAIRKSLLRNQRHRAHKLCWNMQRLFGQSEHFFSDIRGIGLTDYIGICKGCIEQSENHI